MMLLLVFVTALSVVLSSPIPNPKLEETLDILLTSVERHNKKIEALQRDVYDIGDVLEKQNFIIQGLEEIIEEKKDPGYSDDIGHEEVNENEVEKEVISEEIKEVEKALHKEPPQEAEKVIPMKTDNDSAEKQTMEEQVLESEEIPENEQYYNMIEKFNGEDDPKK